MNKDTVKTLCDAAIDAAEQAGALIRSYQDSDVTVSSKGLDNGLAADVVTEVDLKAQSIIEKRLHDTLVRYDLAFLGEERKDDGERLRKDYFWCVDPLDGTLPFCEGQAGYAVSIALVRRDGVPVIGVVYDPLADTLYHAASGLGAYRNRQVISPNSIAEDTRLHCYLDRSYQDDARYAALLNTLQAKRPGSTLILHSQAGAVMSACGVLDRRLLEQAPAVYMKFPKEKGGSLWDYAATSCLFLTLGLPVADIHGAPLALNRPSSTYMNHRGFLYANDAALSPVVLRLMCELQ